MKAETLNSCHLVSLERNPPSIVGCYNPFTARLDTRTLEKLVSVVSTCILHDNITGGLLMFCKF